MWIDDRFNTYWRRMDTWWEVRGSNGEWERAVPGAPLRHLADSELPPPVYVTEDGDSLILVEGQPGNSAYEVAVKNGFIGTEKKWLASLEGDVGPPGPGTPFVFITKADYDALPSPRPTTNLYIVVGTGAAPEELLAYDSGPYGTGPYGGNG